MSKVVYVAGPYTAKDDYTRLRNIQKADEVNAQLWSMGFYALCPHKITAFYGGLCDEQVFIDGGLEFLRRSDAVVLTQGWQLSGGTLGEIEEAIQLNIPVYDSIIALVTGNEINYNEARSYIDACNSKRDS